MAYSKVVVLTKSGWVRGRKRRTIDDDDIQFVSFHGIPYGKPPIGELRFKVIDLSVFCHLSKLSNLKNPGSSTRRKLDWYIRRNCSNQSRTKHGYWHDRFRAAGERGLSPVKRLHSDRHTESIAAGDGLDSWWRILVWHNRREGLWTGLFVAQRCGAGDNHVSIGTARFFERRWSKVWYSR